jgi:hypothetical protein
MQDRQVLKSPPVNRYGDRKNRYGVEKKPAINDTCTPAWGCSALGRCCAVTTA